MSAGSWKAGHGGAQVWTAVDVTIDGVAAGGLHLRTGEVLIVSNGSVGPYLVTFSPALPSTNYRIQVTQVNISPFLWFIMCQVVSVTQFQVFVSDIANNFAAGSGERIDYLLIGK